MQVKQQAKTTFSYGQKLLIGGIFGLLIAGVIFIGTSKTLMSIIALLSVLYFCDMIFNLFLILRSIRDNAEYKVILSQYQNRQEWPTYTVFCPLYKESAVLNQFVDAMNNLDYPKEKLRIMLLLEEDDSDTIHEALIRKLPSHFEVIIVPHSLPKTKPKATNYGLWMADSKYAVIYDAEDVPDPDQLKKAVTAFEEAPGDIACIQAKLDFYNSRQNIITRLFTAEYSLWFNLTLVGLQSIKGPIPLGGTSNHFKTEVLKGLDGWDPYNVTEDCDLGIRLYKQGFRTGILDSTTLEEANSQLGNWIRQRSRWIKGYMQTFLVHSRNPRKLQRHAFDLHIFTFYLVVGGKVLSTLVNPIMWLLTIVYFVFRPLVGGVIQSLYPGPLFYIAVSTLVVGNALYIYYFLIGSAYRDKWNLVKYTLFAPLYWLVMSLAAMYALYQLIVKPHYWEKTTHGLHLKADHNG